MAFFSQCIRGEEIPELEEGVCWGWTVYDQIDYLKSKIIMKERYTRFFTEKINITMASNNQTFYALHKASKKIREKMSIILNPHSKIITNSLRDAKLQKQACQKSTCPQAIWFMDQLFISSVREYDALRFHRLEMERKHQHLDFNLKLLQKNLQRDYAFWEKRILKAIEEQENALKLSKLRQDTLIYLFHQYRDIRNLLVSALIKLHANLDKIRSDAREQLADLKEMEELSHLTFINKNELLKELASFEASVYQQAYKLERQLNDLQMMHSILTKDRIDLKKSSIASSPGVISSEVLIRTIHKSEFDVHAMLPMYEAVYTKLAEVTEANNLPDIEWKIYSQKVMMHHLMTQKNSLIVRYKNLMNDRLALQQCFYQEQGILDWKKTRNSIDMEDLENTIQKHHCRGHMLQKKLDWMGTIVTKVNMSIKLLLKKLSILDGKTKEDQHLRVNPKQKEEEVKDSVNLKSFLEAIRSKIVVLKKKLNEAEGIEVPYRVFLDEVQLEIDMENLKVPLVTGAEFATQDAGMVNRILYGQESEDEDDAQTREVIKAESEAVVERAAQKQSMAAKAAFF